MKNYIITISLVAFLYILVIYHFTYRHITDDNIIEIKDWLDTISYSIDYNELWDTRIKSFYNKANRRHDNRYTLILWKSNDRSYTENGFTFHLPNLLSMKDVLQYINTKGYHYKISNKDNQLYGYTLQYQLEWKYPMYNIFYMSTIHNAYGFKITVKIDNTEYNILDNMI
jgi:predicted porin